MSRPRYKELLSDEYKDRDEQLQWIRNAVSGNAKFRNSEPPYSEEEELARKIMQMHSRIAELEGELAELKERFDITDGLLNQATVSIGAVIACCTYNSNMIDNFIKNYNRAVLDGKASTDVKNIICWPPNPPEVQE